MNTRKPGEEPLEAKKAGGNVVSIAFSRKPRSESEEFTAAVETVAAYIKGLVDALFFSASAKKEFFESGAICLSHNDVEEVSLDEYAVETSSVKASIGGLVAASSEEMKKEIGKPNVRISNEKALIFGIRKLVRALLKDLKLPFNGMDSLRVQIESPSFAFDKTAFLSNILGNGKSPGK
ncbi:MAG: hypothetical protein WC651_01890 [Candidatus Gracilibacteria bacterium]|jgi:hypothetical protein